MEEHDYDMPDSAIRLMWIFLSILIIGAAIVIGMQYTEIHELRQELKTRDKQPIFEVRKKQ